MDPTLLLAGFTLFVALHLLLLYVSHRVLSDVDEAAVAAEADEESVVDPTDGVVACPDCGAENELGYTYCHTCIEELPGAASRSKSGASPGRRGIF